MILAKLGMGLLGAAMKKGAGAAVTSGLAGSMSSGLASSLGKTALGALGGKGGKGGGMGGGRGGMSAKGGMGGQSKGQRGGQKQSGQSSQESFSLEDALNMILEQNSQRNQVQKKPQQIIDIPSSDVVVVQQEQVDATTSFTDEQQVEAYQRAIDVLQAHIVSNTAGRVRIRHPQLKFAQDHQALQAALLQEGLDDVTFKASTGSVLISYDTKTLSEEGFLVAALPLAIYIVCGSVPQ